MNVFQLSALLSLDSSEYDKGLEDSKKKASGFGQKLKSAMKVGGAAIAAVGAATVAMTGAIVKGTGAIAEYGDNIDKMSQKMGMSAETYQEWDAILQHSGSSIESMQSSMKTLANAVETGNDAFEQLGLTQEKLADMNQEEIFAATISALQEVEDDTQRTYLAGKLLGRGATELGALLNTSAEETEAMRQRVHELGGVMSDEAVKNSAAFQDSLQDLSTAFDGLKRNMVGDFMPSLTIVMDGLTELFSGGDGLDKISEGIDGFVDQIGSSIPRILDVGSRIVLSLLSAITSNLPKLIKAGGEMLMTLGMGILEQLPAILDSALEVILTLARGLTEAAPTLIPAVATVITDLVTMLTDPTMMNELIDAAMDLLMALADGLIAAIPILIDAAPQIIENFMLSIADLSPKLLEMGILLIVQLVGGILGSIDKLIAAAPQLIVALVKGIVASFSSLVKVGKDMVGKVKESVVNTAKSLMGGAGMQIVQGIWQGISNGYSWITQRISGWVGNVVSFFKKILKIGSPSKVFADQIGKFMAQGVGVGFVNEMGRVEGMMENAIPDVGALVGPIDVNPRFGANRNTVNGEIINLLRDIRSNMDYDIVMQDGTLVGWMDRALGRRAAQRARGNA